MRFAKIENGQLITTCADSQDDALLAEITGDGFKALVDDAQPPPVSGYQRAEPIYRQETDRIITEYHIIDNDPEKIEAEIAHLQSVLSATDYKIIKAYEYVLIEKPIPIVYDITALHNERQAIRDQINQLKSLLQSS